MTAPTPATTFVHCGHECVCKEYREWYLNAVHVDDPCPDTNKCVHFCHARAGRCA